MSKTNDLAVANGWEAKRLGVRIDEAFKPVLAGIEERNYGTVQEAIERTIVALADCGESLPHAELDDIADTAVERIKRSKAYSRATKLLATITVMLWRVGFTSAETIAELFTRQSSQNLMDRATALPSAWDLISRLYGSGITFKLALVRSAFRGWFNSAMSPADVKRQIAEYMLGSVESVPATEQKPASQIVKPFKLADRTYETFVSGSSVEFQLSDGTVMKRHVASQLEKYETALAFDEQQRVKGQPSNTASGYRLNADQIRAENIAWLDAELAEQAKEAERKAAEAKAKAEAKEAERRAKAEAAKAKAEELRKQKQIEAEAKAAEQKAKAEADAAEAKQPEKQIEADAQRKAEAAERQRFKAAERKAKEAERKAASRATKQRVA